MIDMSVKRKFFSDNRKSKLIAIEALAVTCLFHLALLTAMVYEPSPGREPAGRPQKVTLMNLSNPAVRNVDQIMNWLEYHDPSLMVRANHSYSYAAIARRKASRELRPDLPRPTVIDELKKPESARFEPLTASQSIEHYAAPFVGYVPAPLPPQETPQPHADFPQVWCDGLLLDMSIPKTLKASVREVGAQSTFQVRLIRYDTSLFPRYEILSSSGNTGLDREIVHYILAHSDALIKDDALAEITIIWHDGGKK